MSEELKGTIYKETRLWNSVFPTDRLKNNYNHVKILELTSKIIDMKKKITTGTQQHI